MKQIFFLALYMTSMTSFGQMLPRWLTEDEKIQMPAYLSSFDINKKATNSRNYTQCDSLLMGNKCGAHTVPYIKNKNSTSTIEHEATTTKINEEQLYYCNQRGLDQEEAVSLIVNGFCKEVLQQLPMEFAVEAQKLAAISLEGSVG